MASTTREATASGSPRAALVANLTMPKVGRTLMTGTLARLWQAQAGNCSIRQKHCTSR